MADDGQAKRYLEIDQRVRAEHRAKADEHALRVLPIIQELQATGTTGHRAIARALNMRGVPTRYGYKWHHGTIRNLLVRAAQILSVSIDAARGSAQARTGEDMAWPNARTKIRQTQRNRA